MLTDITQDPFHLCLRVGNLELWVCHVVVSEAEQRGERRRRREAASTIVSRPATRRLIHRLIALERVDEVAVRRGRALASTQQLVCALVRTHLLEQVEARRLWGESICK